MKHAYLAVASLVVVGLGAAAAAGGELTVAIDPVTGYGYLDGPGYQFLFQEKEPGATTTVTVEDLAVNPPGTPPEGFLLLDGTLRVSVSGLSPGDYRMMIRKTYSAEEREHKGVRTRTLQLLRRERARELYLPARCLDRPREPIRPRSAISREEFKRGRTNGGKRALGLRGVDASNTYVWCVLDKASDFAVGGVVPEPLTMGLLLTGAAGLLLKRRPRA
jgi:hypothetical protein